MGSLQGLRLLRIAKVLPIWILFVADATEFVQWIVVGLVIAAVALIHVIWFLMLTCQK